MLRSDHQQQEKRGQYYPTHTPLRHPKWMLSWLFFWGVAFVWLMFAVSSMTTGRTNRDREGLFGAYWGLLQITTIFPSKPNNKKQKYGLVSQGSLNSLDSVPGEALLLSSASQNFLRRQTTQQRARGCCEDALKARALQTHLDLPPLTPKVGKQVMPCRLPRPPNVPL